MKLKLRKLRLYLLLMMALEHGIGVAFTCLINVVYFLAGQVLVRQPDI